MHQHVLPLTAVIVCAALAPTVVMGQDPSFEYGMPFRAVRAAGNAACAGGELFSYAGVGAVAYECRIAEREVTTTQWLEFVHAHTPYYTGNPEVPGLNGNWIRYDFAPGQYHVVAGAEQYAAGMSWRMAARFCNWLHNGKVNEARAFESGAYDTSTFGFVGSIPHVRSPWGLLDVSGGLGEWLENANSDRTARAAFGSQVLDQFPEFRDRADYNRGGLSPDDFVAIDGLRLAAVVPGPGSGGIIAVCTACFFRRDRR
jgi:hypothetical protein